MINPTKGHKTMIYDLAVNLAKKGHKISILQPESTTRFFHFDTQKREIDENIRIIKIPCVFLPKIRYTIPNFLKEYTVLSSLIDEGVDVVHIGEYFYPTVFPPLALKKRRNIPMVVCSDALVGISWKYSSVAVDWIAHTYTKTIGKSVLTRCDAAIFLYEALAHQAESLHVLPHKIKVIPNGVDTELFSNLDQAESRRILGIDSNEKVILSISRLVPVKGIETLIDVTRKLLQNGVAVKTYVVGGGPYRRSYEKKAADLKDAFVFVGNVPYRDIPVLLSACDVFLLASLSEGLPTVVLEAGACGKPVVASNVGGVPDIITHGESGFLVNPQDRNGFFTYVKMLLEDESLAKKIASKLNNHVLEHFSWEKIVKKYEKIYEEIRT